MLKRIRTRRLLVAVIAVSPLILGAQAGSNPDDALLDVLVWGTHVRIDVLQYSKPLRAELEQHLQRAAAYRSSRQEPSSSEMKMVHAAQIRYERRLAALSDDAAAPALAAAYVDRLRPCYEWEGYHDCPEHEALFADEYQAAHTGGPFSAYLPLLSAHRWLCTAEAYDYEKRPQHSSRARRLYEERIAVARQSASLLVRAAAERLSARGACRVGG